MSEASSNPDSPKNTSPLSGEPNVRLSESLNGILKLSEGRNVTVQELEDTLKGRGFALMIFLLSAPFLIPAPGLSVPFGIAISILGVRIILGQKPKLPDFILRKELSHQTLVRFVNPVNYVLLKLERFIRPRLTFLRDRGWALRLVGLGILLGGFVLALPLPVPLSNLFPALSIMCLAAGLMERDGVLVLWGYGFAIVSWIYLGIIWIVAREAILKAFGWLS